MLARLVSSISLRKVSAAVGECFFKWLNVALRFGVGLPSFQNLTLTCRMYLRSLSLTCVNRLIPSHFLRLTYGAVGKHLDSGTIVASLTVIGTTLALVLTKTE